MNRLRTTLVTSVLAAGLALSPTFASALAQETPTPSETPPTDASEGSTGGAGGDTAAIAINTKDGTDIFRIAFAIKRAMGDVVDNGNAAVAFASCTDCETVAVSIQVVLLMNDPSIVTPTNLAIAINQECTLCETLASAYQVILTTDGPVRFTPAGYREIAAIRRELLAMRDAGLTIEEILVRLDKLMDRFFRVLTEEMLETGSSSAGSTPAPVPAGEGEGSPSSSSSPSPEPSTAPTESPSLTESPSPTPSPSDTPSPSASP
jgi:putative peptide zinc metalloprotease protein